MIESLPPNILKFSPKLNSSIKKAYVFDIETDGLYDEATKIHCIVFYDIIGDRTYEFGPRVIDAALLCLAEADLLIGHNITNYDIPVIEKLWPETLPRNLSLKSLTRYFAPGSSGPRKNSTILIRSSTVRCRRISEDQLVLKPGATVSVTRRSISKSFLTYSQEMLDYCKQDVSVTTKLFQSHSNAEH